MNSTPSAISRSISSVSSARSFWQISRVCSPAIGAGRSSARGMCANSDGLVSVGIGWANSGWTMSVNDFRCTVGIGEHVDRAIHRRRRHAGVLKRLRRPALVHSRRPRGHRTDEVTAVFGQRRCVHCGRPVPARSAAVRSEITHHLSSPRMGTPRARRYRHRPAVPQFVRHRSRNSRRAG